MGCDWLPEMWWGGGGWNSMVGMEWVGGEGDGWNM